MGRLPLAHAIHSLRVSSVDASGSVGVLYLRTCASNSEPGCAALFGAALLSRAVAVVREALTYWECIERSCVGNRRSEAVSSCVSALLQPRALRSPASTPRFETMNGTTKFNPILIAVAGEALPVTRRSPSFDRGKNHADDGCDPECPLQVRPPAADTDRLIQPDPRGSAAA
jgi:hypothetical protein